MLVGAMNNPKRDACAELAQAVADGFDFLDLTVEGPRASIEQLDVPALQRVVAAHGIRIVGHTAPWLPFASPVPEVRAGCVAHVQQVIRQVFAPLAIPYCTVHVAQAPALFPPEQGWEWNSACFRQLADTAEAHGMQIVVEHPPSPAVNVATLQAIFATDDRLGFHLDIGHAFVGGDRLASYLDAFRERLVHVHASDNRGRTDDHRPLGDGRINWQRAVRLLQQAGYDGTVTLEVFSTDRDYLRVSANKWRTWWQHAASPTEKGED